MKRFNVFLSEDQISYLKSLVGTISEHIRHAVNEYIDRKKNLNVSSSQSKSKGGDKNG